MTAANPLTNRHLSVSDPRRAHHGMILEFCIAAFDKAADKPVRFIQVGANDGVLADPIRPYIDQGTWHGMMIEPHPAYFSDLTNLHGQKEGITLVNSAVSDEPGTLDLHHLAEAERGNYPRWARGCASFDGDRLAQILDGKRTDNAPLDRARDIACVTVPLERLDTLLAQHNMPRADFLIVDVEGFEPQVLRSFDIASLDLSMAVIECNSVDAQHEVTVLDHLTRAGLVPFRLAGDLVGIHPDRVPVAVTDLLPFIAVPPLTSETKGE